MKILSTIPRMQRMFVGALLFILINSQSFAQTVLFRDDFNGAMQSGWTWVRENPATWSLTPTGLQIESEYGDLWQGWTNNCQNMLLRPAPSMDFVVEAKLDVSLVAPINQAHLLLYYNDDYYVRFGPVLSYGYQVVIDVVHEVGGGIAHQSAVSWGNNLVYLKIQKSGSSASCYYSSDGQNWQLHHTISDLNFSVDQVGLVAFDGSEPPSSSVVTYDYFQISESAPPPVCVNPPSGLVSWWPGESNANDIQSSSHGTLQNGATFAAGKVGQAFNFDGVDDGINIPKSGNLDFGAGDFSIGAWVNFTEDFAGPNHVVIFDNVAGVPFYRLFINPVGEHAAIYFRDNFGNAVVAEGATPLNDGNWHYFVGTRDGQNGHIYVDGTLVATASNPSIGTITTSTCTYARIGATNTGPGHCSSTNLAESFFKGLIDEIEIYNRALSASEIQSIYNAGSAGKCKECTPPEVSITGNDPVCPNSPHTYTANTDAANPTFEWSVTGGTINGSNTGSSINVIAGGAGTMVVSVEVTDGATNCSNSATLEVSVEDHEPPVLRTFPTHHSLWPPNHQYETILVAHCVDTVGDNCALLSPSDVVVDSVSSDEPEDVNGGGDGNTINDIVIANDCKSVQLRRERQGGGNGRVYTLYLSVRDGNGNIGAATCFVTVPHSQNGNTAVDNGPAYFVFGNCSSVGKLAGNTGKVTESATFPEGYALFQNYPNPFNPSTVINFALPEAEKVTVSIYSETGQLVRTLVDNEMPAGQHVVSWNGLNESGNSVAAGVYLYRLVVQRQNGETAFAETRRMILLK